MSGCFDMTWDSRSESVPAHVDSYADFHIHTTRDWLRRIALTGLSCAASIRNRLKERTPRVQFLLLHHLFQDEEQAFRGLLASLSNDFRFISYSEAVTRILHNNIDDAYLAFSFDDGQKSCLSAASILQDFGATGCFFVCPDLVEETDRTRLARICRERLCHPLVEFMNWTDIESLLSRGHEVGGHTCSHVNLAQVPAGEAAEEIQLCRERLQTRLGKAQHFAWPYGRFREFTRSAGDCVFNSGFVSCASGVRGSHGASEHSVAALPHNKLCIHRDSIVAGWPLPQIRYFLGKSARSILQPSCTWPGELASICAADGHPCESPSTQFLSSQGAA